jgi:hypothetical protein
MTYKGIARRMLVKHGLMSARIKCGARVFRYAYVIPAMRGGPMTPKDVAAVMLWTSVNRQLDKVS